mmetsp:Transcript_18249/g.46752  ORF Transcript_18249/g.46752 Transcript_18249/m.46752 type:complete len:105 (+) Transcript_18249:181-495(+)|eukprot:jgi/Tetstr1/444190/TSEL_032084.t1
MPQKQLGKGTKLGKPGKAGRNAAAGKKHNKLYEKTKKGRLNVAPKKTIAKKDHAQNKLIARVINAKNEETHTAQALNASNQLSLLRAGKEICESLKAGGKRKKK